MEDVVGWAARLAPGGGLVGLVFIAVLAVWRGWLVPRGTLEMLNASAQEVVAGLKDRLEESKVREHEWKAAYDTSEAARQEQAKQLAQLLEYAKTTDTFMRALPRGGGEPQ